MGSLTAKDVGEIAVLARLLLEPDEAARLERDLASILDYVEQLRTLDTDGVEPMTHAVPVDCPLRPDAVGPTLATGEVLARAPGAVDDFFVVPRIIGTHRAPADAEAEPAA